MTCPTIEILGKLLSRKEAARYLTRLGLATAPQTLARKFHEGTGPLCRRVAGRALYRQADLDDYFIAHLSAPRRSSSEPITPEHVAAPEAPADSGDGWS